MEWLAALGGLTGVAAFIGAIAVLFRIRDELANLRAERRKTEAERKRIDAERAKVLAEQQSIEAQASEKITATALSLIGPLETRVKTLEEQVAQRDKVIQSQGRKITALQDQVDTLRGDLEEWQCGAKTLTDQVVGLGHKPAWEPRRRTQ